MYAVEYSQNKFRAQGMSLHKILYVEPPQLCSMSIKIQPDATVCRYLFTAKSLYMFRVTQHPSSGVLKTLTAASGTGHNTGTATSLQRALIGTPQLCSLYTAAIITFLLMYYTFHRCTNQPGSRLPTIKNKMQLG
jgi:hypothetical protein